MHRIFAGLLMAIAFLAPIGKAFAQNVDQKVLGIESGMYYAMDVSSGDIGSASAVALSLTLADNLSAGFVFLNGDGTGLPANAGLLALNLGLADRYGLTLMAGNDGTVPLVGTGFYFNIFERKFQDALITVLKAKIEYIFAPSVGMDAGDLCLGMSVVVGL